MDFNVPDSAGTATAMVTGVKTSLGVLGVDATVPRNSCDPESFEKAKLKNMMHWAVEQDKVIGKTNISFFIHGIL